MINKKVSVLLLVCVSGPVFAEKNLSFDVSPNPPSGFSSVNEASMMYDIYVNGSYSGTFLPHIENGLISFNQDDIESIEKTHFIKAFSTPFSRSESSIRISTETSNIDIDNTLMEIRYVDVASDNYSKEHDFSWTSSLRGENDFDDSGNIEQSYYANYSASFKDHRLKLISSYISDEPTIEKAAYSTDIGADVVSAGLMRSGFDHYNMLDSSRMIGVGYQINDNNEENAERLPVVIDMLLPGRVVVRRDGELLRSIILPSGVNEINPKLFPSGNYLIDIDIKYDDGSESKTSQFLSSSKNIAGGSGFVGFFAGVKDGSALYGYDEVDDETSGDAVFRTAYFKSLGMYGQSYLNAGFSSGMVEINPSILINYPGGRLQGSYYINDDNGKKGDIFASFSALDSDFRLGYYYRSGIDYDSETAYARFFTRMSDKDSISLTASSNINSKTNYYQGNYTRNLLNSNGHNIEVKIGAGYGTGLIESDTRMSLELVYRIRPRGAKINYSGSAKFTDNEESVSGRVDYGDNYGNGLYQTSFYGNVGDNRDSQMVSARLNDNRYGEFSGQVSSYNSYQERLNYGNTSFNIGLAGGADKVMLTGSRLIGTGVIIDLSDYPTDNYRLKINDRTVKVIGGQKNSIPLVAGKKYNISLFNESNPNIKVVQDIKSVQLMSGNISFLDWEINEVKLLSGRAMFNEKPIANSIVKSGSYTSSTDDDGKFLIEMNVNYDLLQVGNKLCTIDKEIDGLVFEEIACKE